MTQNHHTPSITIIRSINQTQRPLNTKFFLTHISICSVFQCWQKVGLVKKIIIIIHHPWFLFKYIYIKWKQRWQPPSPPHMIYIYFIDVIYANLQINISTSLKKLTLDIVLNSPRVKTSLVPSSFILILFIGIKMQKCEIDVIRPLQKKSYRYARYIPFQIFFRMISKAIFVKINVRGI